MRSPPTLRPPIVPAKQNRGANAMTQQGRVVFSAMEEVVFGRPAAEAVAELAQRRPAPSASS